jgi:hypothetical protein
VSVASAARPNVVLWVAEESGSGDSGYARLGRIMHANRIAWGLWLVGEREWSDRLNGFSSRGDKLDGSRATGH